MFKIAAVAVAVMAVGATIGVLLIGTPSTNEETYDGVLISSEILGDPQNNYSAVVGYKPGESIISVVPVVMPSNFTGVVGGHITVRHGDVGSSVVSVTSSPDSEMSLDQLRAAPRHTNVMIDAPSLSLVRNGYTYAVASNESFDYCWVAPGLSITGIYEPIELNGTTITDSELAALATAFPGSRLGSINTNSYLDLVSTYSFNFNGDPSKLLLVDRASYLGAVNVTGDALHTLLQGEAYNFVPTGFYFDGLNWLYSLARTGTSITVFSDSVVSADRQTLWIAVHGESGTAPLDGVCTMRFAIADSGLIGRRCVSNYPNAFTPMLVEIGNYTLHIGVALSIENSASRIDSNVTSLWDEVAPHDRATFGAVSTDCWVAPVSAWDVGTMMANRFGFGYRFPQRLNTFAMSFDQTLLLLLDERFGDILEDNGTPAWDHAAFAIVPWSVDVKDVMRATLNGVLYDVGEMFGADGPVPMIIADSIELNTGPRTNTSIPEMTAGLTLDDWGTVRSKVVGFDAVLCGDSLSILSGVYTDPDWGFAWRINMWGFATSLALYEGFCMEGSTVYHIPIICTNGSFGFDRQAPPGLRVEGIYFDLPVNSSAVGRFVNDRLGLSGPPDAARIPPGVNDSIASFQGSMFSGPSPRGFVLAYRLSGPLLPSGSIGILSPPNEGSVALSAFNITFNVTNPINFPRWLAVTVYYWDEGAYTTLFHYTVLPVLRMGAWSTAELPFWQDLVDVLVATHFTGDCALVVIAGDFTGEMGSSDIVWLHFVDG